LLYINDLFYILFFYANVRRTLACVQHSGGLAKLGRNCTLFGLSPTVKGRAEVRVITLTPISPNRLCLLHNSPYQWKYFAMF